jgi:hypothetical protein
LARLRLRSRTEKSELEAAEEAMSDIAIPEVRRQGCAIATKAPRRKTRRSSRLR